MRFCVLNDQPERREGLKALLRQLDRHAKFSEAKDWRQIDCTLKRVTPDLLVIDWQRKMLVADLWEALHPHPSVPVAVLTDDAAQQNVTALLDAGALGVVPRHLAPQLIVRAFEIVLLGGHYVPADALNLRPRAELANCARRAAVQSGRMKGKLAALASLSPRQRQIMRFVHLGATNKVIARTLGISEGTVKIHLASVFQQLGANNRAAAVALYNGWQLDNLDVLRDEAETPPKPPLGQTGPVPLRQRAPRHRATAANEAQQRPLAVAEPVTPYASPTLSPAREWPVQAGGTQEED
jgi:DNA-binding NarL/FixJ family response regulator